MNKLIRNSIAVCRKFRHTANIGKNYTKDDFDKLLIDIQNEEE